MRHLARKAATSFLLLAFLVPAYAEAASLCQRLNAKLASATTTIGNTGAARKYSQAITRQQREIRKVTGDLRRLGCSNGSIVVIGGQNAQNCSRLEDALGRMQKNLSALEAQKGKLVSPSISPSARKRILASLEANGCNELRDSTPVQNVKAEPSERKTMVSSFAEPEKVRPLNNASQSYRVASLGGAGERGYYRTLCVRTCDGAFFPISSNASPRNFERDAQVCSMMCPGIQTQLFYHSVVNQESSQMVSSLDGTPYEEMPFAYKYRNGATGKGQQCGCNFSAYYKEMLRRENGETLPPAGQEAQSSIVKIGVQTALRESLPAEKAAQEIVSRPYNPEASNVRKVGPVFLPEQTAIDLRHPAEGPVAN